MESVETTSNHTPGRSSSVVFRASHDTPMHQVARNFHWAESPLGPPEKWPTSLRTIVSVMLGSQFPLSVWWGPELVHLYNDAACSVLGDRHPGAFATSGREVWGSSWKTLGKHAHSILAGGPPTQSGRVFLPIVRGGFLEEAYCDLSYSPIPDDAGAVGGVLVVYQDVTEQVQQSRQLQTLRDLAACSVEARSEDLAGELAMSVLESNDRDIPFAMLYICNDEQTEARLMMTCGLDEYRGVAAPPVVSVTDESALWPFADVAATREPFVVSDVIERFGTMPGGAWSQSPSRAVCIPLIRPTREQLLGFLICGVSPRRKLTDRYLSFFRVVGDEIAASVANARAYQEEHRRAVTATELGVRSVLLERELEESRDHDRRKDEYLAMLAHELRNPLAPLQIALHILRETATLDEDATRHVEVAQRQVGNLSRIVSDLLDVSRLTQGKIELFRETLDVGAAVRSAVESTRDIITAQRHRIEVVLPDQLVYVRADAVRLEQVLVNLLTNAAKYTDPGGRIRVIVERRLNGSKMPHVLIKVQDNGVGIPPHMQARLFDLFEQGGRNTARQQGGLGIGLTIVRNLVELHGGTVSVRSDGRGKGSEFTVRLMEVPAPSRELRALPRDIAPGSIPSRRVLVVDDNHDMADMLCELLNVAGHEAKVAYDGPSAIEVACDWKPDVIFLDLGLPTMSGLDVARVIQKELKDPPYLVALTGLGRDADMRESQETGFQEHLVKPAQIADLLRALARSTQGA